MYQVFKKNAKKHGGGQDKHVTRHFLIFLIYFLFFLSNSVNTVISYV